MHDVDMTEAPSLKLKIQIYRGGEIAMGPGKADLLDAIMRAGSISAAGRLLGMSYRRCWVLVEVMNRCWRLPLVETLSGGRNGGGAHVTETGQQVLAYYRALQRHMAQAADSDDWQALHSLLLPDD
tara:strand:+ start:12837 stop:13214 length:378 start_codon:yes stop_codon:yes gene_type:complete